VLLASALAVGLGGIRCLLLLHLQLTRPLPESLQAIDIDVLCEALLGLTIKVPQMNLFELALFAFNAAVQIYHCGQLSLRRGCIRLVLFEY